MSKGLEELEVAKKRTKVVATLDNGCFLVSPQEKTVIETELKALDILTNNLGIEMSIDGDFALLFVRIAKDIKDPRTYNYCIVGAVEGKENIEALKCALKYYEDSAPLVPSEELVREIMGSKVITVKRTAKGKIRRYEQKDKKA